MGKRVKTVYVDATPLLRQRDGVGSYTAQLLKNMLTFDNYRFIALGFSSDASKPRLLTDRKLTYEFLPLPRKAYSATFKLVKPIAVNRLLKHVPDAVLYPNFVTFPYIKNVPSATVIHDLVHLDMPDVVDDKNRKYLLKFIPFSIKKAGTSVVGTSDFVAASIEVNFNLPERSVFQAAPGINVDKFRVSERTQKRVRKKYGLPASFILFVGSLQPRKNIDGILAAFTSLPTWMQRRYPLVLAGALGWKFDNIARNITALQATGTPVLTTGFVKDEDLPALYSLAAIFVFPSFYEGFGMPVLEAFASGTPVVAARGSGLDEVSGDAAVLVDPSNALAIGQGIRDILSDDDGLRAKLQTNAKKQLRRYTWKQSAERMSAILDKITS